MKCEICHSAEAGNVLKSEDGRELYVCDACAAAERNKKLAAENLDREKDRSKAMKNLLSATLHFVKTIADAAPSGAKLSDKCPKCSLSLKTFDKTGVAGCPECYNAFAPLIEAKFFRSQAGRAHIGERPAAPTQSNSQTPDAIKAEIKKALAREDYKLAAELKRRLDAFETEHHG